MDKAAPATTNAYAKQSSIRKDDGPHTSHGNAVLPSILAPIKHGYINPRRTSRPSAWKFQNEKEK